MTLTDTYHDGFVSLCYHYVRPNNNDLFPRLLGAKKDDFVDQVRTLKKIFCSVDPKTLKVRNLDSARDQKIGLLFTFDDGLSDHYVAAEILAEEGVPGLFFIPTCILRDGLPANPMVIHYAIALYGVSRFLKSYRACLRALCLLDEFDVGHTRGDDVWSAIKEIKMRFKYHLPRETARKILIAIYQELLVSRYPEILENIHLSVEQINSMVSMGHSIGAHSHTHISVADSGMTRDEFEAEIIKPRVLLESLFGIKVLALSYPFGGPRDCFNPDELRPEESGYEFAFTVEQKLNTPRTNRFELGRYMPLSTDNTSTILDQLYRMTMSQVSQL